VRRLFDSLTVAENVGFNLIEHTDLDSQTIAKRIKEALSWWFVQY